MLLRAGAAALIRALGLLQACAVNGLISSLERTLIPHTPTPHQAFLDEAEKYGKDIPTSFADGKREARNVASEARTLKRMFLKLRD